MPMFRNRHVYAEQDLAAKKTMTTRPWEQPDSRDRAKNNESAPEVDEHLSELGKWLKGKYSALMAYVKGDNANQSENAAA